MGGNFSWVGLLTSDLDSAMSFYRDLFGWECHGRGAGSYAVFKLGVEDVALVYEITDRQRALGASPNWASFVSVPNAGRTAARAAELGGALAIPPYDAADAGRIAVIQDLAGARLSLWETRGHPGPARRGAIGTCCWNELVTPDPARATRFYADLFGWDFSSDENGVAVVRHLGRPQAGIRELRQEVAEDERPRWLPYFRVTTLEDESPVLLRDREGATFGLRDA